MISRDRDRERDKTVTERERQIVRNRETQRDREEAEKRQIQKKQRDRQTNRQTDSTHAESYIVPYLHVLQKLLGINATLCKALPFLIVQLPRNVSKVHGRVHGLLQQCVLSREEPRKIGGKRGGEG